MGCATTPTHHTARFKLGVCSICGDTIHIGQRYDRWRWFDSGDASTIRVHPDCWALFDEHGISEWSVSDTFWELLMEMPRTEARETVMNCQDIAVAATWMKWLDEYWEEEDAD